MAITHSVVWWNALQVHLRLPSPRLCGATDRLSLQWLTPQACFRAERQGRWLGVRDGLR